jgi:hypothetical protein
MSEFENFVCTEGPPPRLRDWAHVYKQYQETYSSWRPVSRKLAGTNRQHHGTVWGTCFLT